MADLIAPDETAFRLELTAAQLKIVHTALKSLFDDLETKRGVIDLLGLVGYFSTVSMVMNVAHTPPPEDKAVAALAPFPL